MVIAQNQLDNLQKPCYNGAMHSPASTRAFTLIELSIVLVIIGLIVGGILAGRDMIRAATIRKAISQFQDIEIAYNLFKNKYQCLPGDCARATSFNLGTSGNGDGNYYTYNTGGMFGGFYATDGDMAYIFDHIENAGFFKGKSPELAPISRYSLIGNDNVLEYVIGTYNSLSVGATQYADILGGKLYMVMAGLSTGCGNDYCPKLSPLDIFTIDSKIDDAQPLRGNITALDSFTDLADGGTDPSRGAAGSTQPYCITTSNGYNLANTSNNLCLMGIYLKALN